MRFHVIRSALDFDFSTRVIGLDTRAWLRDADNARNSTRPHIAFDARHRYASRSGRYAEIIANISGRHRPAGGRKLDVPFDFFDADGPGGGLHLYRAAHSANGLRAGRDGGTYFRIARHQDRIGDADVTHARHFLADPDGVAPLLDGRIGEGIVQALLRIVKAESRCAHFAAHMYFAVGACCDVHVSGGVGEFDASGSGHVIVAIEATADGRPAVAADQDNDDRKEHER